MISTFKSENIMIIQICQNDYFDCYQIIIISIIMLTILCINAESKITKDKEYTDERIRYPMDGRIQYRTQNLSVSVKPLSNT